MKSTYYIKFILLISCLTSYMALSQEVKIEITKIENVNNKLVITYNFDKELQNEFFDVWIEITTLTGSRINAKTLSGDIGDFLSAGTNKQITWDYVADDVVINEEINIEVKALASRRNDIVTKSSSKGKAMLLSTVMPGLGLTKLDKGKPYWLMGVSTYLLAGTSLYFKNMANTAYSDFENETDTRWGDYYYNKGKIYDKFSKNFALGALGIWGASMLWTALKPTKASKVVMNAKSNQKLNIYSNYDCKLGTVGFTLKYRF